MGFTSNSVCMHRILQAQQQEAQEAERKAYETLKSSLLAALETVNESLPSHFVSTLHPSSFLRARSLSNPLRY